MDNDFRNGRMSFFLFAVILCSFGLPTWAATHDEIPQCGLSGIYKTRQTVIESPNYPDNYPANICQDYVIRSPYRCPTKFHIQFLDFYLESSRNCTNDYLAIGLENDGDDMDVLCGEIVGIRKYHTPDGVLRLRFFADDSPWTRARGFKLLITRLACEREDLLRDLLDERDNDSESVSAPPINLQAPQNSLPQIFRNLSFEDQHRPYLVPPVIGYTGPHQLPSPPLPGLGGLYLPVTPHPPTSPLPYDPPCTPSQLPAQTPEYYNSYWGQQLPSVANQYRSDFWQRRPRPLGQSYLRSSQTAPRQHADSLGGDLEPCCASNFNLKRFYLSSPGFPRTVFTSLLPAQQKDCQFQVEKADPNICSLRIHFKFFDFGQTYSSTGVAQGNINVAIGSSKDVCTEDYLEIEGERFCGCRTGYTYKTNWPASGEKLIRMRMGYSGISSNGFLLDIFQDECSAGGQGQQLPGLVQQQQTGYNNFVGQQLLNPQIGGLSVYPVQQSPVVEPPIHQTNYPQQFTAFLQQQQQQPIYQQQQPIYQQQQPIYQQQQPIYQQQQPIYQQQQQQQPFYQQSYIPALQQQQQQFGYPQYRQSRGLDYSSLPSAQKPLKVVETNQTRKEYYYYDGDEVVLARAQPDDEPDDPKRKGPPLAVAGVRNRCTFDMADIFKLSVDYLWIMKPTCFAPMRRWFSNVFG